jgi:hypothetical protein
MARHPQAIPPAPEEPRRVAPAAFPRGHVDRHIRDARGALDGDHLLAPLCPVYGQPAAPPWHLALTTVMPFAEGLSDRQAADAVCRRMDWQAALSSERTAPGCDPTVLREFPRMPLPDGGYGDAELLGTAESCHQSDVVGPPLGSYRRPRRARDGYDLGASMSDGAAQQARCPHGRTSLRWTPGRDVSGDPVVRTRFHGPTCRACPVRQACTQAKDAPRQLTVRPPAQHEAIRAARQRQETAECTAPYARRAGMEGTPSQAVRRCGLRPCRDVGHV